ncbi:hypothetical protein P7C70_g6776, partial [Phenoliferia sp. Uapishka_3]
MEKPIFLLFSLAGAALAQGGSFGVPFVRRSNPSSYINSRAASTSTVTVGAVAESYFAVGTPPVQFLALLDTGSSDLVVETAVQASSCVGCETTGPLYSASSSSSAVITTTPVDLLYAIGNDTGVIVTDLVSFGGFSMQQTMAACDVNDLFASVGASTALLGLGWTNLAVTNSTPFFQQLWESGLLSKPVFGLGFAESAADQAGSTLLPGGYLTLGDTNSTLHSGEITWVPLAENGTGYWDVPVDNTLVNGRNLGMSTTVAVIDSSGDFDRDAEAS